MLPEPTTSLDIVAELVGSVWTLYALPLSGERQPLGSGRSGTGIMFPVKMLETLVSDPS